MGAHILNIKGKLRQNPIALVSLDDFQYEEDAAIDPHVVLEQANISLYCLDHANKRAIFVETSSDVNLAAAPFYYEAQYQSAQRLIAVSYDTLHALAREIHIDPSRIILIYSVGRCGSTLVSYAFNQADGVVSFSEPDVYTQVLGLRATSSDDAEITGLVRTCVQIMCASALQSGRATAWALKFRSFVIELGDIFYHNFPDAKVIFLYRNAESWARSVARAFNIFDPQILQRLPQIQQLFSRFVPLVAAYTAKHTTTISPIHLLTCMWISNMERCLALQRQGVPMLAVRYEDLQTAPHEVLHAMFEYCGVKTGNSGTIDKILEQDSQAGTGLSQANAQMSSSELQEHHLIEMRLFMHECSDILTPDFIVPNTFLPISGLEKIRG